MDYTLDDLKGKYVKVGTPEAEIFLDACEELGVRWRSGAKPKKIEFRADSFSIDDDNSLGYADSDFYIHKNYKYFVPKPQWSIYTNDKPLCELSDCLKCAMFLAWQNGGKVQYINSHKEWVKSIYPFSENHKIYRIKQKSERELFVEAAEKIIDESGCFKDDRATAVSVACCLINSGKFKLVKD